MRDDRVMPGAGWVLACVVCSKGWPDGHTVNDLAEHWATHEGETFDMKDQTITAVPHKPYMKLVWGGPGPEPKRTLRV